RDVFMVDAATWNRVLYATSGLSLVIMCQNLVSVRQPVSVFHQRRGTVVHDFDVKRLSTLPTSIGTITRLAYARAKAAGIELESLLKKAGLTKQQIEDIGARLSVQRQISFLNLVASALQDESLGFHLAQKPDLRELGLLYYVPASSEILGEALRRVTRYSSMA